jgi:hypothetical protein
LAIKLCTRQNESEIGKKRKLLTPIWKKQNDIVGKMPNDMIVSLITYAMNSLTNEQETVNRSIIFDSNKVDFSSIDENEAIVKTRTKMMATVNYVGTTNGSRGHYTASIASTSNEWIILNDSTVTYDASFQEATTNAIMIFCQKE